MASPISSLVKAYLSIGAGAGMGIPLSPPSPGLGMPGADPLLIASGMGQLTFKFNPKEYSVSKSANWREHPIANADKSSQAHKAPNAQFVGAGGRSMTIEIFLDNSDSPSGDVSLDVEALMSCCNPLPTTQNPPVVVFGWGPHVSFPAYVKSVSARYTLFRADGRPYRATCSLTLQELPVASELQNPTSGTKIVHRSRTIQAGDTLASISYQEYGTPTYWRALAELNAIDDPMAVHTGTRLLVPPPDEARARS